MVAELPLRRSMGLSLAVSLLRLWTLPVTTSYGISVELTGAGQQLGASDSPESAPSTVSKPVVRRDTAPPASDAEIKVSAGERLPRRNETFWKSLASARCVVPGHLALPMVMTDVTERAKKRAGEGSLEKLYSQGETCLHSFKKAANMTSQYMAKLVSNAKHQNPPQPPPSSCTEGGWLYKAKKEICTTAGQKWDLPECVEFKGLVTGSVAGNASLVQQAHRGRLGDDETMEQFQLVLDNIEDGDTTLEWNSDDANMWECCNVETTGHCPGKESLEGHTKIGDEEFAQGDEYTTPGTGSDGHSLLEHTAMGRRSLAVENLWPANQGTTHEIAYCFSSSIGPEARSATEAAVEHIQTQIPCIKFKPVGKSAGVNKFALSDQENCATIPSVIIQSSQAGCWSPVGYISGRAQYGTSSQPINIGKGCEDMGIVAHEWGHTLGLLHEMSRSDREAYVEIKKDNIQSDMMNNFNADTAADNSSAFDFLSLMMYGSYAFSTNGELTIAPKDLRLVNYMGQRMGFSELDVELIGNLYGCVDSIKPQTKNKHLSEAYQNGGNIDTGFTGTCVDQEVTGYVRDDDSNMPCGELKKWCAHDTLGEEIKNLCPVSCYMCEPCLDCADGEVSDAKKKNAQAGAESIHGRPIVLLGMLTLALSAVVTH